MRRLIEDLHDIGKDAAWEVIEALTMWLETRSLPEPLKGEAKLLVIALIGGNENGKIYCWY